MERQADRMVSRLQEATEWDDSGRGARNPCSSQASPQRAHAGRGHGGVRREVQHEGVPEVGGGIRRAGASTHDARVRSSLSTGTQRQLIGFIGAVLARRAAEQPLAADPPQRASHQPCALRYRLCVIVGGRLKRSVRFLLGREKL